MPQPKRAALYARYSSELQRDRSIEDQFAVCASFAELRHLDIVARYADRAISGASMVTRPELGAMLDAAARGTFDVIVCEALDRLSRDQEDIAHIFKRLRYRGVGLLTLAEGEVTSLHIGLKGTMNAMFLEELGRKVKRGQQGRLRAGKIPGGLCYGYSVTGEGERTIDETEAAIVRRIFADYDAGMTPLAIARALNRAGVPSPRGGAWNASTLNGSRKRGNGILNNQLYAGRLVWNRQCFVKDPDSGKRQARPNAEQDWMVADRPDLRIVPEDLWQAVQRKREACGGEKAWHHRKPKRVLSGLLVCAACGGSYIFRSKDYVGCSTRLNQGTCDNARIVTMREIETRVLAGVKRDLLAPEAVKAFLETYRQEMARLRAGATRERSRLARAIGELERKSARLVRLLEEGAESAPLLPRLAELEGERRAAEVALAGMTEEGVIDLHPKAAASYAAIVGRLEEELAKGEEGEPEAFALIRRLVQRIVVQPRPKGQPVGLEIHGDLAAVLARNEERVPLIGLLVAGTRNSQSYYRPPLPVSIIV